MEIREASNLLGDILHEFLKSGPTSAAHIEDVRAEILAVVHQVVESPQDAAKAYATACKDFFAEVEKVKGMPSQKIFGDGAGRSHSASSSGQHIAASFAHLVPALTERYNFCLEKFRDQSQIFFSARIDRFQTLLLNFLGQVPVGGTKDKAVKSTIVEIKRELRTLLKWSYLFSIYKQTSFTSEIRYIFARHGGAIAAMWHYSQQDEDGEYDKTYDHRSQDNRAYAVRDNWAIRKGLMNTGPYGYLDDITRPTQEIGCCCDLEYFYALRDLPEVMLSAKGNAELDRTKRAVAQLLGEVASRMEIQPQRSNTPIEPRTERSGLKRRLMSWLRRAAP